MHRTQPHDSFSAPRYFAGPMLIESNVQPQGADTASARNYVVYMIAKYNNSRLHSRCRVYHSADLAFIL